MNTETPSEKLTRKPRPIRALVISAAGLALIAAAAVGVPATVHALSPTPKQTPTLIAAGPMECDGTISGQGTCTTADEQSQADQKAEQMAADKAAAEKAAADAAAAQAAAEQAAAEQAAKEAAAKKSARSATPTGGGSAGLPSGAAVPQPNGYPDTTQCASGSASTVNGVPTCD